MATEQETATKTVTSESTELAPQTTASATTDELSEVKQATQALVDALQGLARAKIQSATDVTQETYQSIEQSVRSLRDKADRNWQAVTYQVEDIDSRLTKAAKAAWEVLTAPPSDSDSESIS